MIFQSEFTRIPVDCSYQYPQKRHLKVVQQVLLQYIYPGNREAKFVLLPIHLFFMSISEHTNIIRFIFIVFTYLFEIYFFICSFIDSLTYLGILLWKGGGGGINLRLFK